MTYDQKVSNPATAAFLDRVWTDEAFAARLDRDPKSAMAEYFGEMPEGLEVRVVRDTPDVKHLHIPAAPVEGEIDESDLMGAQGGTTNNCMTIQSCIGLTCPFPITVTVQLPGAVDP
ncbi:hypothetical protein [Ruegeria jejuensis]|uniref:hypothetical protein n=1 Tax=Ruegeria jejuensis TaxID=3233338 RepID=UPI00355BE8E4